MMEFLFFDHLFLGSTTEKYHYPDCDFSKVKIVRVPHSFRVWFQVKKGGSDWYDCSQCTCKYTKSKFWDGKVMDEIQTVSSTLEKDVKCARKRHQTALINSRKNV
jgi:hypothetical protein